VSLWDISWKNVRKELQVPLVMCGYDGSDPGRHALKRAADLARRMGADLRVLVVGELIASGQGGPVPVADPEVFENLLQEGLALATAEGGPGVTAGGEVVWGRPGERMVAAAAEAAPDVLVLGHRGKSGLETLLLGSVAKHVIDHAACPVLVVR
jgi:nucleotide-binding universal stress UspA family protein